MTKPESNAIDMRQSLVIPPDRPAGAHRPYDVDVSSETYNSLLQLAQEYSYLQLSSLAISDVNNERHMLSWDGPRAFCSALNPSGEIAFSLNVRLNEVLQNTSGKIRDLFRGVQGDQWRGFVDGEQLWREIGLSGVGFETRHGDACRIRFQIDLAERMAAHIGQLVAHSLVLENGDERVRNSFQCALQEWGCRSGLWMQNYELPRTAALPTADLYAGMRMQFFLYPYGWFKRVLMNLKEDPRFVWDDSRLGT